jgi:hypothetical protein
MEFDVAAQQVRGDCRQVVERVDHIADLRATHTVWCREDYKPISAKIFNI